MGSEEMGRMKDCIIGFILGLLCCALIDYLWTHFGATQEPPTANTTEVRIDTVKHHVLIPRDSIVVSYKTKYRHKVKDSVIFSQKEPLCEHDTVILPVMQKHYKDSLYDVWVSGYEPNLDSINIYQRTKSVKTVIFKKPKFGVGLQFGVGYKNPYIGIGVQYNIFTF